MKLVKLLLVLTLATSLTACSSKKKGDEEEIIPAEDLYNSAMDKLESKKYKKAIEDFEELERTYPYSKWAVKAEIMSAYSSFRDEEYTDALVTLERFISLHPGNKDAAYAYYLRALCYYEQISDVKRDQSYTASARDALHEVVVRFPETDYARDAQLKLDLVTDHLAGKEVEVGRFYLKQNKYIAAINRFKVVVDEYQTTSHVPEALHRLVESYSALGLKDEANKYASVLGYNYPGSKWYKYSYDIMEGKVGTAPELASSPGWFSSYVAEPIKRLKKQPNLADTFDREVKDLGENLAPLTAEPADAREVKINEVPEQPSKPGLFKRIKGWFGGE